MTKEHEAAYIVWPFDRAPQDLQDLSTNGGDEDWLVLIPPGANEWPRWFDALGCCDVSIYTAPDGRKVAIGSHA